MGIQYEVADAIATVTIDRPEALNALDIQSQFDLRERLTAARDDDAVRVIIVTGVGDKSFCVGSDLKKTPPSDAAYVRPWTATLPEAVDLGGYVRLLNLEPLRIWKPIIAVVNGYCFGGGLELAMQCDLRVAAETASFALPEVKVGSAAGICGPMLLRLVPHAYAMKALLTGDHIKAAEALRIGLVSDVWPSAELRERAGALARKIAANAPLSVTATKRLARETETVPRATLFEWTEMVFGMLKDTEDRKEGRLAFAEKRPPRFTGR